MGMVFCRIILFYFNVSMVSAIITTHNRKDLLARAIISVFSQTYKDLELIVVSDGSTDGTDEFMKKYETNEQVNYISYYPGRGGNYARNQGIKAARGEFVAFLDDDDEWLPEKIEKQLKVIESDPKIGLVYTGTHSIYVDYNVEYYSRPWLQGNMSRKILLYNFVGSTTTVMLKKTVFEKTEMFDETLSAIQDYDLWIRICQEFEVGVVSEPLANYYNYNSSGQISSDFQKYEIAYEILHKKYEVLFKKLTKNEWNKKVANQEIEIAIKALRNGNAKVARSYYKKSLKIMFQFKTLFLLLASFFGFSFLLNIRGKMS